MTGENMNGTDSHRGIKESGEVNDSLSELFRNVSARQRPPAEDERFVRQALHGQWLEMTRRRRGGRLFWAWAVAASIVLAAGIALSMHPGSSARPQQQVASVNRSIGQITVRTPDESVALQDLPGQELMSGQMVTTALGSRLGLTWANRAVLRLDELSELTLVSPNELFLANGRIYLDTALADDTASGIRIRTPQGLVQHLGTRFMTEVTDVGTSVSIREGRVAYFPSDDSDQGRTVAGAGQQLAVGVNGKIAIEPVKTWGAAWLWAEQLSPGFTADGRSLADLLDWAGRESGRKVQYISSDAEMMAAGTELRGDVDVPPMEALSIVTATSDLRAEVSDGLILVSLSAVE